MPAKDIQSTKNIIDMISTRTVSSVEKRRIQLAK